MIQSIIMTIVISFLILIIAIIPAIIFQFRFRWVMCKVAGVMLLMMLTAGIYVEASKEKSQEEIAAETKEARKEFLSKQFSAWDGSHKNLEKVIKASMHNPGSYKHVETRYVDFDTYLLVQTTFRGTNSFGAIVTNKVSANVDMQGNVLEVIED